MSPAGTSSPTGFFATGLLCAKKRIFIVRDKPACSITTIIRRTLLTWRSVALRTGYKLRRRKTTESPKPTATKVQLRISMGDQLIIATGIQMRLE